MSDKITNGLQESRLLNKVALAINAQFACGPAKAHQAAKAAVAAYEKFKAEIYMQNTMS